MKKPIISIIIPTKNEEKNIRLCLESIKHQTYPHNQIEVIIVDNHSTDVTRKIAREYTPHIFIKGPERSAQRNFGAKKSRGKYFLYLDADMTLSPSVIQEAVEILESNIHVVGLYIPELVTGNLYWSQVRRFERSFYYGTVIDCIRIVHTADLKKVGGFDETLTGPEDWDFDKKIRQRGQVRTIKSPMYHNETEFNIGKYLKKKYYYAKTFDTYINKWGKDDPDIKKQFSLLYRFGTVFIENGHWKELFKHPWLTAGMIFLRILVGIQFLRSKKYSLGASTKLNSLPYE